MIPSSKSKNISLLNATVLGVIMFLAYISTPDAFAQGPPRIQNTALPPGVVDTNYSFTMVATGGTPPYTWTSAGLPAGLLLGSTTGRITGKPTTVGSFQVIFMIRDATNAPADKT